MASYDFSAPFVAARIIDNEGNIFPLWANTQGSTQSTFSSESRIDIGALAFLQSVTVELDLSGLPKISASLAPPYEQAIKFLDSKLADSGGANYLEVQFGYTGGVGGGSAVLSPVYGGLLMNPEVDISEEVTIQLNAQGTGGFALVRQVGTRTAREGETRRELIRRIVRGPNNSRNLRVDFTDADTNDRCRTLLDQTVTYTQGGRSDWFAIWELTNSAKCWLLLIDDTLRVLSRASRLTSAPTRKLYLYNYPGGLQGLTRRPGQTQDDAVGLYPILQFSSPTNAVYLPAAVRGVVMEDVDDTSREAVREDINDSSERPERTGEGAVEMEGDEVLADIDETTGDGGERRPGDPADQEALESAREDFIRGGNLGVQVELETLGIPDIVPGEVVQVAGVGQRFGRHNYGVHKVTHNVGLDGFTSQLTCVSNVDSLLAGIEGEGPANTQEAQTHRTDTVDATADEDQGVPA